MKKTPFPLWLKVVIAVFACAIVLLGYSAVATALGFKRGGGYLVLILLFSLLGGIWRAIVRPENKEKIVEEKEEKGHSQEAATCPTPMEEDHGTLMTDSTTNSSSAIKEEVSPKEASISTSLPNSDYHIVLRVLLILMMIVGAVVMLYQAIDDFTWENYTVGWIRLVSSLIGLTGFILLYLRKLLGFITIISIQVFGIVYSAIMHDPDLGMAILAALFKIATISLFLFIRKNGVSAWSILLHRHRDTISDLKETFPINPFLSIDKGSNPAPIKQDNSTSNFEEWLKK